MNTIYLGLGSSLGDKEIIMKKTLIEIEKWGENFKSSSFFYSEPWGGVAQNQFLNTACRIDIKNISPEELLQKIHALELKFNRTRTIKWEDRTLDIDILLYGNQHIQTKKLIIPHQYLLERDFVYTPLLEIFEKKYSYEDLKSYINIIIKK